MRFIPRSLKAAQSLAHQTSECIYSTVSVWMLSMLYLIVPLEDSPASRPLPLPGSSANPKPSPAPSFRLLAQHAMSKRHAASADASLAACIAPKKAWHCLVQVHKTEHYAPETNQVRGCFQVQSGPWVKSRGNATLPRPRGQATGSYTTRGPSL